MTSKAQLGKGNQENSNVSSDAGERSPVTAKLDSPTPTLLKTGFHLNRLTADEITQLHRSLGNQAVQRMLDEETAPSRGQVAELTAEHLTNHIASPVNRIGPPDQLKAGLECLSGFDLPPFQDQYQSAQSARIGFIQAKLMVNPVGDPSEQEADQAADRAIHLASKTEQRPCVTGMGGPMKMCFKSAGTGQRMPVIGTAGGELAQDTETMIQNVRGGGQILPDDVRGKMEQAYGADFSGVRVHTGSDSDWLNRRLHSRAFTIGADLFFKPSEYRPTSFEGQRLIAHELAHVVQQNGAVQFSRGHGPVENSSRLIQRDWEPFDENLSRAELRGGLRWYYNSTNQKMRFVIEDEFGVSESWRDENKKFAGEWKSWDEWIKLGIWGPRDLDEFPGDTAYVGRGWKHKSLEAYYRKKMGIETTQIHEEISSQDSKCIRTNDPPNPYSLQPSHNPAISYYFDIEEYLHPDLKVDFANNDLSQNPRLNGRFSKLIIEGIGPILAVERTYQNAAYLLRRGGILEITHVDVTPENLRLAQQYFPDAKILEYDDVEEFTDSQLKMLLGKRLDLPDQKIFSMRSAKEYFTKDNDIWFHHFFRRKLVASKH